MQPKYNLGERVVVVNYGHKIYQHKKGQDFSIDFSPELVGQKGIIVKVETVQNMSHYALGGIEGKHAWYNEDQIELIK